MKYVFIVALIIIGLFTVPASAIDNISSIDDLLVVLNESQINNHAYSSEYNCVNYSTELINELSNYNLTASYVTLLNGYASNKDRYLDSNKAHRIVYVIINDEFVFIEPQLDKIMEYEDLHNNYTYSHVRIDYEDKYKYPLNLERPSPKFVRGVI